MDKEHTVTLSSQEASDLVDSLIEAIVALDVELPLRESWADEMSDWILLILARQKGGA